MSVSNFGPDVQFQGEGLQVEVDTDLDISGYQQKITEKFSMPLVFRLGVNKELKLVQDKILNNKSYNKQNKSKIYLFSKNGIFNNFKDFNYKLN